MMDLFLLRRRGLAPTGRHSWQLSHRPPTHTHRAPFLHPLSRVAQLEAAGLVAKLEGTSGGRYVTSEGKKEVDTVARSAVLTA